MQKEKPNLFDQIFFESDNLRLARRKTKEATRRVCSWFNKKFNQIEPLPEEFKNLNTDNKCEKAREIWQQPF